MASVRPLIAIFINLLFSNLAVGRASPTKVDIEAANEISVSSGTVFDISSLGKTSKNIPVVASEHSDVEETSSIETYHPTDETVIETTEDTSSFSEVPGTTEWQLDISESVANGSSHSVNSSESWLRSVRPNHPCLRTCMDDQPPMVCHYQFGVEWYYAMGKACYNCSHNSSDCYRPECIAANGMKRTIITVNRILPGPSIEVCEGDHIIVDVANHMMDESTSVHWHGHHQRSSPYMDGVPFVSQCPISPNSVFRYQYVADNPGTHFWHSHSGVQRGDGSFGSLIIRTPVNRDPHAALYDEDLSEHTIVVLDWSLRLGVTMLTSHYLSDGDNKPESMLVNGKGRFYNDTDQITTTPLEVFNVKKGRRYRFRLINAGVQNCPIDLSIDNHTLTVISSDGSDIKPKEVESLVSYAGERWDFILTADSEEDNYWMRFTGLMDCDERFTKAHQVAILHYEGAPQQDPAGPVGYNVHPKAELQLNALNVGYSEEGTLSVPHLEALDTDPDPSLTEIPDQQIFISYDFYPKDNPHYHKSKLYGFFQVAKSERVYTPQFNDISMKLPHFPLMSQFNSINQDTFCDHQSLKNCNTTYCQCTNVINIPLGHVVEIILIDKGVTYNANHPFHIHGHSFRVVGMDRLGQTVDVDTVKALDKANMLVRNLTRPPIKDTVTVPDGGYTILRMHASNPGYWLFHCHIEFHVEVGMALIFKVGEHSDFLPVPEGFPTCGDYYGTDGQAEIDFHQGQSTIKYNVTVDSSDEENLISFAHWWPLSDRSHAASAAVSLHFSLSCLIFAPLILVFS